MKINPASGLLVLVALLWMATPVLAWEDSDCLDCHGDPASVGEELAIDQAAFAVTPHAEMGCSSCHGPVSAGHPDDGAVLQQVHCEECHAAIAAEYAVSVHAGNARCQDCHNPHAVRAQDEVAGEDLNRPCAACHDFGEMAERHRQWLPQTASHLSALPCISCHTGSEKLVLNLYLVRDEAGAAGKIEVPGYEELKSLSGDKDPARLVNQDGNRVVSLEELRTFNRNAARYGLRLHGMLVPAHQTHDYDILYNRWDCTFCHATGPGSLQTSYLHLPAAGGSFTRMPVENGAVLAVLYTTPDFYMVGATRNTGLNVAGAMILAGGLVMPLGHGLLRFLTRKNRQG